MARATRVVYIALMVLGCTSCGRNEQRARTAQPPAEATSYEFLGSVLSTLSRAHRGVLMVRNVGDSNNLVDLMTANQNAELELRMAVSELQPFSTSLNSHRREAVEVMTGAYGVLIRSFAIQLAAYERIDSADVTKDISALAGLSKKASDAKFAYQQGSSLLADGAVIAFGSSMVPDHGDTTHMALDLTDSQRLELIARCDSLFGPETGNESGPIVAAHLLRTGLGKQRAAR